MAEPGSQYTLLSAILAIVALVWGVLALSAFANYRAFKLRTDLYWVVAFLLLTCARIGDAYVASHLAGLVAVMPAQARSAAEFSGFYGLRLAGLELAATFLVFYLFRLRR